jgi:D-proline reductase (dithiol) PrdB
MSENASGSNAFEAFKDSFFYGERSNLNFKFISHLDEEAAAAFFDELLRVAGDMLNDGRHRRLLDLVLKWQARGYTHQSGFAYKEGPFTRPAKPAAESRLALLTSSGHFVAGDDPAPFGVAGMTQKAAEDRIKDFLKLKPTLSSIPVDTPGHRLRVRHGGYDIQGALADANVAFPLERLRELRDRGRVGDITDNAYTFVGACSQKRLLKESGPQWAARLAQDGADAALLVPL